MQSAAPARAVAWAVVGVCALRPLVVPAGPPALAFADSQGVCALAPAGSAPACGCARFPGRLRRLLGLPIPLHDADAADLQALPGIGPQRARAIVEERARGGRFDDVAELERVRGIGAATAERVRRHLFTRGPDPACSRE